MRTIYDELVERFEIQNDMSGYVDDVRVVGHGYKRTCDKHYLLRLHTLPGMKFYLKRDFRGEGGWLIFSGFAKTAKTSSFFNPVGSAYEVTSDYLKLSFNELDLICYLRLSPKDFHYNMKVA